MPSEKTLSQETINVRRDGTVLVAVPHPSGDTELVVADAPSFAQIRISHVQGDGLTTAVVESVVTHALTPPAGSDRVVEG